jgi:hypothetical protein
MDQDQAQQPAQPKMYAIHNTSRARHNRKQRAGLPQNPRMKQYVGETQQRLVRGQPILVSEEMVKRNLAELQAKAAAHMLELRTTDGRLVDLKTMQLAPQAPTPPLPHPLLDSVRNDRHQWKYPEGYKFVPPYQSDDVTMPNLLPDGEKPQLFAQTDLEMPAPAVAAAQESLVSETGGSDPEGDPVVPVTGTVDPELEAALAAAQVEASEEPAAEEGAQAEEPRRGRRNRR